MVSIITKRLEKDRKWREENQKLNKERNKKKYERNKINNKKQTKSWFEKKTQKVLDYQKRHNRLSVLRKYGLTILEYEEMLQSQNGVCKICGKVDNKNLAIDHNHDNGKIRGLLCGNCNKALGFVKDSTDILRKMIEYLDTHNS